MITVFWIVVTVWSIGTFVEFMTCWFKMDSARSSYRLAKGYEHMRADLPIHAKDYAENRRDMFRALFWPRRMINRVKAYINESRAESLEILKRAEESKND